MPPKWVPQWSHSGAHFGIPLGGVPAQKHHYSNVSGPMPFPRGSQNGPRNGPRMDPGMIPKRIPEWPQNGPRNGPKTGPKIRSQVSRFRSEASDLISEASELRPRVSELRPQVSDLSASAIMSTSVGATDSAIAFLQCSVVTQKATRNIPCPRFFQRLGWFLSDLADPSGMIIINRVTLHTRDPTPLSEPYSISNLEEAGKQNER